MTNYELYKDYFDNLLLDILAVTKDNRIQECSITNCNNCIFYNENENMVKCINKKKEWLSSEYKNDYIYWNDVPVDTQIYVKAEEKDEWIPRYFARFENNKVYVWISGKTSFTCNYKYKETDYWTYAKLKEEDAKKYKSNDYYTNEILKLISRNISILNDGIHYCEADKEPDNCKRCIIGSSYECPFHIYNWLKNEVSKVDRIDPGFLEKIKVDTPIYVSLDGEIWFPRYFAKYDSKTREIFVWNEGQTSFSTENKRMSNYPYIKLCNKI